MTLIIGPQLEALLGNIHEDLKGKTKLEEPHVSKKVLLGAVRQQNQVIQFMQTMLHDQIQRMECMESAFKSQSQTLHILSEKVEAYQKTVDRVKVIDDILNSWREKIELVDVLDENVKKHDDSIIEITGDMKEQSATIKSNKQELDNTLSEIKIDVAMISKNVADMPNTIQISSDQVSFNANNNSLRVDSESSPPINSINVMNLTEIVIGQDKRFDLLEECTNGIETTIQSHSITVSKVEDYLEDKVDTLRTDVDSLTEWKEEQSSVDLTGIQRSQDAIDLSIQSMQHDILNKTTRVEVEKKLEQKFSEIIDHLQQALLSTEKDEADFKKVTEMLNSMCISLKETKADKEDITNLRKQFIENQIETKMPSTRSNINNEDIRILLNSYPTKDFLTNLLEDKADKNVILSRLDQADTTVQGIEQFLHQIMSILGPFLQESKLNMTTNICHYAKSRQSKSISEEALADSGLKSQVSFNEVSINGQTVLSIEPTREQHFNKEKLSGQIDPPGDFTGNMGKTERNDSHMEAGELLKTKIKERKENPQFQKDEKDMFPEVLLGKKKSSQKNRYPTINRDRMKLNPHLSLGGGYQLDPPVQKKDKEPLRALDQYQTYLPVSEVKKMVCGEDGRFYVSSRRGGSGSKGSPNLKG